MERFLSRKQLMSDPNPPTDTIRVVLDMPRAVLQQLVDQLGWPADPALSEDLRAIRERSLAALPPDALAKLIPA
jgi:hypothetical protein